MTRGVYLIAYDIRDPRRLARVHRYLLGYKVGGQKSVYECWLTPAELARVRADLEDLMDLAADRIHILQLDPRMRVRGFGVARPALEGYFAVL